MRPSSALNRPDINVKLVVAALVAAGLLAGALPTDSSWQVFPRLCVGFLCVQVLPGWLLLRRAGWFSSAQGLAEWGLLSYAVSYVISTITNILVTVLHLNVTLGVAILLLVVAWLAATVPSGIRRPDWAAAFRPGWAAVALAVGLTTYIVWCAWALEPAIGGEEVFELTVLRKIVENPTLTLTNVLHRPDASFPYLFTPFYFATGMIVKVSGLPLMVVYLKLRIFYVLASLLAFFVLARRFSGSRSFALLALLGVGLLVAIDPDPSSWPASLFPSVRRGAFSAGVLVPLLILCFHHCVFLTERRAKWAFLVPALLVFATLSTQSMGVVFFLFWAVSFSVAVFLVPEWKPYRRNCLALVLLIGSSAALFMLLHRALVGHVGQYLQENRVVLRTEILQALKAPLTGLFGGVPPDGRYLIAASGAVEVYSIIPILLLPVLILAAPVFARTLWIPLAAPIAIYSSPLLLALLQFATLREANFAAGYFTLLGLLVYLAVAYLGLSVVDRALSRLTPPSFWVLGPVTVVVCVSALIMGQWVLLPASWQMMAWVVRWPAAPSVIGCVVGLGAWLIARRPKGHAETQVPELAHLSALSLAFVCLLAPVFVGMKAFPGALANSRRESTCVELEKKATPSIVDWANYYAQLQTSLPFDMPSDVLEDLRKLMPPNQVVIYEPSQSIMIPLFLNQYIVNPGVLFSTDVEYYKDYVVPDVTGANMHPIYNGEELLSDRERAFIDRYHPDYVLASSRYANALKVKLAQLPGRFSQVYKKRGFVVYQRVESDVRTKLVP